MSKFKRYKISKFCKYMGVTTDTVKHYQNYGILEPDVDPENNYRYYNITHGERIIVSRKYRNLGFNMEDTKELITNKSGIELQDMLQKRQDKMESELRQLEYNYKSIQYLTNLCDLFNHKVGTYYVCNRPEYYFYRHTYNFEFIEENIQPSISKELMSQLPNASKMILLPHETLLQQENKNYYHVIGLEKSFASVISKEELDTLECIESAPAVLYIYSRPHRPDKIKSIYDIYQMLLSKGYHISDEDIMIEHPLDFYVNQVRYENYLIYFPLKEA